MSSSTNSGLYPRYYEAEVAPSGKYPVKLITVEAGSRKIFGSKSDAKEPCFVFTFECSKYKDSDGNLHLFVIRTGIINAPNSTLRKLVDRFVGRSVSKDESNKLDLSRCVGWLGYLIVTRETGDNGDYNKIVDLERSPKSADFTLLLTGDGDRVEDEEGDKGDPFED